MYECPHCGADINQATELCPRCGTDLTKEGEPAAPVKPKSLRSILTIWGFIIIVVVGGLWGFIHYVMPIQRGDDVALAESTAVKSLRDLNAALTSYAVAQPNGGFPASLESLGAPAVAAARLAQSQRYELTYTPAAPGTDGTIHGYTLQARAGNYGFRNFFMDDSGALHATRENRAATSSDPPM